MRRITVRLAIAVLTFIIGVGITAFWLIHRTAQVKKVSYASPCKAAFVAPDTFTQPIPNFYFPAGAFLPDETRENGLSEFYVGTLTAMREPSLSSLTDSNSETYRFLWRRAFHPPVAIRLWRHSDEYCMTVKQLADNGKYTDGEFKSSENLTVNVTRPLSQDEWTTFKNLLDGARFWELPTVDGEPLGLDGAFWVLEGAHGGRYHVVDRQSPDSGAYYDACVYLIRRSGIAIDETKHELY